MVDVLRFTSDHLGGVVALCEAEGWPSFPADPQRAARVLTAPGVTTVVAVDQATVIGFAEVFSDGELQAFLANLAVDRDHRGRGIGRKLVVEALRLAGAERMDLLSEDEAIAFYESFPHFRKPGFRLYVPPWGRVTSCVAHRCADASGSGAESRAGRWRADPPSPTARLGRRRRSPL